MIFGRFDYCIPNLMTLSLTVIHDPFLLEILYHTQINCIELDRAAGSDEHPHERKILFISSCMLGIRAHIWDHRSHRMGIFFISGGWDCLDLVLGGSFRGLPHRNFGNRPRERGMFGRPWPTLLRRFYGAAGSVVSTWGYSLLTNGTSLVRWLTDQTNYLEVQFQC